MSALLPASGASLTGASYTWTDTASFAGAHYWLQVVTSDGTAEEYGPVRPAPPAVSANSRVFLPLVRR